MSSRFWWSSAVVIILCGTTYQLFQRVIYPRLQRDYVIVKNYSPHTLEKMTVTFESYPSETMVFKNIPSGGEEWKLGNRDWGSRDSARYSKAEGKLSSGQHIGPRLGTHSNSNIYLLWGDSFEIVVNENGSVTLPLY